VAATKIYIYMKYIKISYQEHISYALKLQQFFVAAFAWDSWVYATMWEV